jgi:phytol kinase
MSYSKKFSPEVVRKFIHIAVSNWWIILLYFFDNLAFALIGPISFVLINSIAVFSGVANFLGVHDIKRNLGLIYFPISLMILVILCYTNILPVWAGTIGVFAMGYGDGLAALLGHAYGKKKIWKQKSLLGSIVMCITTFIVIIIVGLLYHLIQDSVTSYILISILLSAVITLIELFTPSGLDNISVPLSAALLATLFLGVL